MGLMKERLCCTKPSIDLVIFEKAYYYPLPVTDSCHGFGNLSV